MTFPFDEARSMWRVQLDDGRVAPIAETALASPHPKTGHTHEATVELGANVLRVGATSAHEAREKILSAVQTGFGETRSARIVRPGEPA